MINHDGRWLPSINPWIWILLAVAIVALLLTALSIVGSFIRDDSGRRNHEHWVIMWLAPVALALVLGIALPSYYPYEGDYHRLQPVSGTVAAVDTRFLAASQYVVVTYDTGVIVRCDDSRCATVKPGEKLRLLCTKEHQFGSPLGADGWGCRWGEEG